MQSKLLATVARIHGILASGTHMWDGMSYSRAGELAHAHFYQGDWQVDIYPKPVNLTVGQLRSVGFRQTLPLLRTIRGTDPCIDELATFFGETLTTELRQAITIQLQAAKECLQ